MFSVSNKQFILLLCLTLNIININECSDQNVSSGEQESIKTTTKQEPTDDIVEITEADFITETVSNEAVTDKQEQNENKFTDNKIPPDNLIRSHNYRSSYKSTRIANKNLMPPRVSQLKPFSSNEKIDDFSLKKRKKKKTSNEFGNEIKYNVGPGVNISVEKEKELVSVYLDEDCLKDVFTGNLFKLDDCYNF